MEVVRSMIPGPSCGTAMLSVWSIETLSMFSSTRSSFIFPRLYFLGHAVELIHEREGTRYQVNPAREREKIPEHRRSPETGRLRLDEAPTDGITDQTGSLMNVQFRHNPGSVGLCGFCADPQHNTDLLGGFPLSNELEHLPLSTAQRLWRQLGFGQIGLNDRLRDSGSQIQL